MLQEILTELGLADKEIQIYLSLLELGSAPASILGQRAKIRRSTAQYTCQQLVKKGLFNVSRKGNTFLYTVENPEKLKQLLREKQEHLESVNEDLDRIMNELKAKQNPHTLLPQIQFFEGEEGIKKTYDEIAELVKPDTEILSFAKVNSKQYEYNTPIDKILTEFTEKTTRKGLKTRALYLQDEASLKFAEYEKNYNSQIRLVKNNVNLDFEGGELMIYQNHVWTLSLDQGIVFGYHLRSKSIAALYQTIFEIAWQQGIPFH